MRNNVQIMIKINKETEILLHLILNCTETKNDHTVRFQFKYYVMVFKSVVSAKCF